MDRSLKVVRLHLMMKSSDSISIPNISVYFMPPLTYLQRNNMFQLPGQPRKVGINTDVNFLIMSTENGGYVFQILEDDQDLFPYFYVSIKVPRHNIKCIENEAKNN